MAWAGVGAALAVLGVGVTLAVWRPWSVSPPAVTAQLPTIPAPEPLPVLKNEPVPKIASILPPPPMPRLDPLKPPATPAPPAPSRRRSFDEVVQSVARIEGERSSGTGFLVAPGVLATSAHVIEGEYLALLRITFPKAPARQAAVPGASRRITPPGDRRLGGGMEGFLPGFRGGIGNRGMMGDLVVTKQRDFEPTGPIHLIFKDSKRDLALLQVSANAPALEVAEDHVFHAGEDVRVVGNPRVGGRNHISPGILSTQATIDGQEFDQLAAPINPGDSGGPVLDDQGRVIGIASMKAAHEQGIAFSIPARDLKAALDSVAKDKKAIDELTLRHEARVLLKNLALAGSINVLAVGEAGAARAPDAARKGWIRELHNVGLDSLTDEDQVFNRVAASPNLSSRTRGDLDELRRLVDQLHKQVVGTVGFAAPVVGQPRKRIEELVAGLSKEFDVEINELAAWAPPLEVVSLNFDKTSVGGIVRNTSGGVLEKIQAHIVFVHPLSGQILHKTSKKVVPELIEPGEAGKFFANLPRLPDPRVLRLVLFMDAEGEFLPYRRTRPDEEGIGSPAAGIHGAGKSGR